MNMEKPKVIKVIQVFLWFHICLGLFFIFIGILALFFSSDKNEGFLWLFKENIRKNFGFVLDISNPISCFSYFFAFFLPSLLYFLVKIFINKKMKIDMIITFILIFIVFFSEKFLGLIPPVIYFLILLINRNSRYYFKKEVIQNNMNVENNIKI